METLTLQDIADLLSAKVEGDASLRIEGLNSLDQAQKNELSFFSDERFRQNLLETKAGALLVPFGIDAGKRNLIRVNDVVDAFDMLVRKLLPGPREVKAGVHPTAVVHESVKVPSSASVGAYCVLEEGVQIEEGVILHSHVVLDKNVHIGRDTVIWPFVLMREYCRLGKRCVVHAGVQIGFDGFGFDKRDNVWKKNPQRGNVVIEDDVEIGSGVTIARARFGTTRVGEGCKIDAGAHLGHNVQLGKHVYFGAMSGLAGTVKVGDHAIIAPQCGAVPQVTIPAGTVLAARAVVTKDLPGPGRYSGMPAIAHIQEQKRHLNTLKIETLREEIKELRKKIEKLNLSANA
jgi:UDP-3-O-[3-hydroxymyristoyl] glucosamine N-acyltransferase